MYTSLFRLHPRCLFLLTNDGALSNCLVLIELPQRHQQPDISSLPVAQRLKGQEKRTAKTDQTGRTCADPESFARGGPTLTTFFF